MTPNERRLITAAQRVFKAKDKMAQSARSGVSAPVFMKSAHAHSQAVGEWIGLVAELTLIENAK